MADEIRLGPQRRDLHASRIQVERKADQPMRLRFAISSEAPVDRWFGTEVLSHADGAIRLDRARQGALTLLFNHNWDDAIGMIDAARVEDARLVVEAHLFDTPRAKEVAAMIDGGLRNVSLGYQVHVFEERPKERTYTATDWEPLEGSIVTVPADPSVGIGRADSADARPVPVRTMNSIISAARAASTGANSMADETAGAAATAERPQTHQPETRAAPGSGQGPGVSRGLEIEQQRKRGIENLCRANKIDDSVRDYWIGTGLSMEQVSEDLVKILEERGKTNPQSATALGLSPSDTQRYSLFRAIKAVYDQNWSGAGFELECSRAIAAKLGRLPDPKRFFVPFEVQRREIPQQRDLQVAVPSAGGYLVATNNMSFIEMLRVRSVAFRMGARRLSGLVGNVTIPKQIGSATAAWLATETSQIPESNQTFGQLALSPKTVGAYTEISRQLLLQSSPDAEAIVSADLAAVAALAVDAGVLRGSGTGGEPLGIENTPGIGAVAGATLGYAGLLELQVDVAAANVQPVSGGYATTPTVAAQMMQRQRFSGTDTPVWAGNLWEGQMAGFRAMASNQMAAGTMLFGDWAQVIVGEWGVLEVEVNPYANFQAGIIGVRAMVSIDVGLRHAAAFSRAATIT